MRWRVIDLQASNSEFVELYRRGTPTSKIAVWAGVAETTVRYHLQIAAKQNPGIRDEHKAAGPPELRTSEAGLRNLAESWPSMRPRAGCGSGTGSRPGSGRWDHGWRSVAGKPAKGPSPQAQRRTVPG